MQFSVNPDVITPILKICAKISNPGGLNPVFGCVKVLVDKDKVLTLSVLDSHIRFSGKVDVSEVQEPGIAIVEAERFYQVFRTRTGGTNVEIKKEDSFLTFKQKEFRAKLPLLKSEEFPEFDFDINYSYSIELTPEMLRNMARCASVVESKGKGQFNKGLLLDFEKENTLWVFGYTNILAHIYNVDVEKHGGFRCAIDASCLPLIVSYVGDSPIRLFFDVEKSKVVFSNDKMSLLTTFMGDEYPRGYVEYLGVHEMKEGKFYANQLGSKNEDGSTAVIKSTPREVIEFNRDSFMQALTSAASVLDDGGAIEFHREERISEGEGIAEFVGYNYKTNAKASEKILTKDNLKSAFVIGMNSEKVSSVVSQFKEDIFTAHVLSPKDHLIFVENGRSDFASIVMPISL